MKRKINVLFLVTSLLALGACSNDITSEPESFIDSSLSSEEDTSSKDDSSKESQIRDNELYNSSGLSIKFNAVGASIEKITWKNKQIAKDGFVVGRCANRISNAKFTIDDKEYEVSKNDGKNSLHGGNGVGMNNWRGPFATKEWNKVEQTSSSITYSIHSSDGENGYPGNMDMTVKYTLSESGELSINYTAVTDKPTLCNPTNHLYLSINGNNSYDAIKLWVNADNYTPYNKHIPTGEVASVNDTQYDYRVEKDFDKTKDFDDNYLLNEEGYRRVATLSGTSLGIKVSVFTDRPCLQLYKDGAGSICLETQMLPDMINQPKFSSYGTTILRENETFKSQTSYVFEEI